MEDEVLNSKTLKTDLLVIGGGTAGCYAAITAARKNPELSVLVLEKANVKRSGCLAAGVNALNAYITPGHTVEEYLEYVRWDAAKIIRDDLVLSIAKRFNRITADLEKMGLVILKDKDGNYVSRGKRNIKINGENIKPILVNEMNRYENVTVVNHINVSDLLLDADRRVCGAVGFSVDYKTAFIIEARAVIVATGGASGLYRPNNPGFSRHKMWYSPFNTGAGYAMGIRAGAEMTTFEMRFVAQRIKDTIAPTGTIALGVGVQEVNALGENYASRYGKSTSGRAYGATHEAALGRGPCYLATKGISHDEEESLCKAYLNMAPAQTLKWLETGEFPSSHNVQIEGTEPYIVGGHTASGYWVDVGRRSTVRGLYAAGDVVGGAPKKFVTGALAEGEIAAESVLNDLDSLLPVGEEEAERIARPFLNEYRERLEPADDSLYSVEELEEAMQKTMDVYAGGRSAGYSYNSSQLDLATEGIDVVDALAKQVRVKDADELLRLYELYDRITTCRALIAHLRARRETRWPGFGVNSDYPNLDESAEYYVNSRFDGERFHIIKRELVKGENYEHSH